MLKYTLFIRFIRVLNLLHLISIDTRFDIVYKFNTIRQNTTFENGI